MTDRCRQCGAPLKDDALFCGSCGAPCEAEKPAASCCAVCGKPLRPDAVFCSACGTAVPAAAPQPQQFTAAPRPAQWQAQQPAYPQQPAQWQAQQPAFPQQPAQWQGQQQAYPRQPAQWQGQPFAPVQQAPQIRRKRRGWVPVVAGVLVVALAVTGFWQPGFFLKKRAENEEKQPDSTQTSGNKKPGAGVSSTDQKGKAEPKDLTLGTLKNDGFSFFVEAGTFDGDAEVTAVPATDPQRRAMENAERYTLLGDALQLSCDQYDGTVFGTDVALTVPIPDNVDLDRLVFIYLDEASGETRYLFPDSFDLKAGTMTLDVPHFSLFGWGELTEKEQIDAFLDSFSTKQAMAEAGQTKAAAELEPYVRAKAEALGLTAAATKDLVQSTVNYLGGRFKGDEYNPGKYGDTIETATKSTTAVLRGVIDNDPDAAKSGLEDAVDGALMHAWDELKFNERIDKVMKSEFTGDATGAVLGNTNALARMAGNLASGTKEGVEDGMRERGNVLQNIHPAAELTTKAVGFLGASANMAFTYWKANKVEELYQVYKKGGKDFWQNEVEPLNRDSFLAYLNTSSGLTWAKGIKRFYDMDKVKEVCEKYGWPYSSYEEMPEKYREKFEKLAEDGLMQYFETRYAQESRAEEIKDAEREIIETMLRDYGALKSDNFRDFFHEDSADDYSITNRLERLVNVRNFLSQYINDKALTQSQKDGGQNFGDIINWWVDYASNYSRDEAIDMIIQDLEDCELLKEGFAATIKTMEGWLKFLDSTWNSVAYSSSTEHFYASPACNLREVVEGWMESGISGGVDPGTFNLVFTYDREVEVTENGRKVKQIKHEVLYFRKLDKDHVIMIGDRYKGKTSETFARE